jgi:hypothetical protein
VNDILAGVISGLIMGLTFQGITLVIFIHNQEGFVNRAKRILPQGLSPYIGILILVVIIPFAWGALGAIIGVIYHFVSAALPTSGIGSPTLIFTAVVLFIALLGILIPYFVKRRKDWKIFVLGATFAAVFGWLLPILANIPKIS